MIVIVKNDVPKEQLDNLMDWIKSKNVDIYKALFSGNDDGIILRPNDKIFVDRIGDVVAIKNGVTVPGIYEIKNGENLQKIIITPLKTP